jgi:hypothetical protein
VAPDQPKQKKQKKGFFHDNGLTLAMVALFLVSLTGQVLAGHRVANAEANDHGEATMSLLSYLASDHFLEALTENWESEFLQMGVYVLLTAVLHQRGSAESKKPDEPEEVDEIEPDAHSPAVVRRGGLGLKIYSHSLTIVLFALFALSFVAHGLSGVRHHNREQRRHGQAEIATSEYFASSQFWFESFQNWQSEFLSVGAIVVLSIFLRQKGSPESKPVHFAHADTGKD